VIKSLQQVARERMNEGAETALARYRYAVVPVYGGTRFGAPDHIGSGILLDLPEGHCILTAAHVVDWNGITNLYTGTSTHYRWIASHDSSRG
jgi:hypothetical protein